MIEIKRVEKPWGHEIWWAHTDAYVGKILHVKAGHKLSLQFHVKKDETIYLQSGSIIFVVEEEGELRERKMAPGEGYRILPGTKHRMIALEDSELLEVSTPEVDDVVRVEDDYGREGT